MSSPWHRMRRSLVAIVSATLIGGITAKTSRPYLNYEHGRHPLASVRRWAVLPEASARHTSSIASPSSSSTSPACTGLSCRVSRYPQTRLYSYADTRPSSSGARSNGRRLPLVGNGEDRSAEAGGRGLASTWPKAMMALRAGRPSLRPSVPWELAPRRRGGLHRILDGASSQLGTVPPVGQSHMLTFASRLEVSSVKSMAIALAVALTLGAGAVGCGEKNPGETSDSGKTGPYMTKFRIGRAVAPDRTVAVETDSFGQGDPIFISFEVKNVPPKS